MFEELDWFRFANGDFHHPISVCRLRRDLVRLMKAGDDRVLIHPSIAPKIIVEHRLTSWHFSLLPMIIEFGSVFQDTRDGSLIFAYEDTVMTGKMLLAVVRPTTERHELWLRSLYVVRNKDYERKRKRCVIISIQD